MSNIPIPGGAETWSNVTGGNLTEGRHDEISNGSNYDASGVHAC